MKKFGALMDILHHSFGLVGTSNMRAGRLSSPWLGKPAPFSLSVCLFFLFAFFESPDYPEPCIPQGVIFIDNFDQQVVVLQSVPGVSSQSRRF
jgi:hypothetical protein